MVEGRTKRKYPEPEQHSPRWRRRAAARPGEILDAALTVFVTKGFAATRLDDVAAEAGISKGTLYLYFDNKAELFKEVIRQVMLTAISQSVETAETKADAAAGLRALVEGLVRLLSDERRSAIPKLVISESGNFPELAAFYFNEVIKPMRSRIAGLIRRGVADGTFREVDPLLATMVVIAPGLLSAIWQHTMRVHDSMSIDPAALMHQHVDLLMNGLLADAGKEP